MDTWKIARELSRFKQQLRSIQEVFSEPIQQKRHDAAFEVGLPYFEGGVPLSTKVVLFLIYQPDGIAETSIETCQHFKKKGYAPFIVSNTLLGDDDFERLHSTVWRILVRPNFGYDFGGYRDGVLSLKSWGIQPKRLILLNDSVWFPIFENEDFISLCETRNGVFGTVLRERKMERFLESYFYSLSSSVLEHDAFWNFWKNYKLTSNKYKVIRRGERGFSREMRASGIPVSPGYPYAQFIDLLAIQDEDFLRNTLHYGSLTDGRLNMQRQELLKQTGDDWRQNAISFVKSTLPNYQPYSSYPYAMTKLMNFPFLKKSNDRVAKEWRRAMLQAWEDEKLPYPTRSVLTEVEALAG